MAGGGGCEIYGAGLHPKAMRPSPSADDAPLRRKLVTNRMGATARSMLRRWRVLRRSREPLRSEGSKFLDEAPVAGRRRRSAPAANRMGVSARTMLRYGVSSEEAGDELEELSIRTEGPRPRRRGPAGGRGEEGTPAGSRWQRRAADATATPEVQHQVQLLLLQRQL
ncbi:unnamed protein product [Urochloa humidicola]